jgi:hypothetical protein
VALVNTPVEGVVAPMVVPSMVPPVMVTLEEIRFVTSPFVLKRLVVVADVPVAYVQLKPRRTDSVPEA